MSSDFGWDADLPAKRNLSGLYVAVSGNTSAGKSTLINGVKRRGVDVISLQERALHHPLLRLMFSAPENYAFPIQINFVLQRHLAIYRTLQLDRILLIERSHLDDELFIREHFEQGKVSKSELDAWRAMSRALNKKLRWPDVMVLVNPPPEVSLRRLTESEENGERPCEFPDEDTKKEWVYRWHKLYVDFHEKLKSQAPETSSIIEIDHSLQPDEAVNRLCVAIESHKRFKNRVQT